jgi:hypothetical protein
MRVITKLIASITLLKFVEIFEQQKSENVLKNMHSLFPCHKESTITQRVSSSKMLVCGQIFSDVVENFFLSREPVFQHSVI